MTVFGLLRVKNEARWIQAVIAAMRPICKRIFVLDDNSDDGTFELCEEVAGITVFRSPFHGLDERRDKNFLLQRAMECVPGHHLAGDTRSPYWALAIDGDEMLDEGGPAALKDALTETNEHAFQLPVKYLWDSDLSRYPEQRQIRVDGVYRRFTRPSVFRLFDGDFLFARTSWTGNLHCSSVPMQLLRETHAVVEGASLWHMGYNDRADRLRKYLWYNEIDPYNQREDYYRHCVQGDLDDVPADARLLHAGPLELINMPGARLAGKGA